MTVVGRGRDQYVVRLPDGLRGRIKEVAAQNRRSMNSEIIMILENAVAKTAETKTGSEAVA